MHERENDIRCEEMLGEDMTKLSDHLKDCPECNKPFSICPEGMLLLQDMEARIKHPYKQADFDQCLINESICLDAVGCDKCKIGISYTK